MELFKSQRTVVESCRQTETVFHEVSLAAAVSTVHRAELRNRDVTLVDEQQIVVGEEIKQTVRTIASLSAVEIACIAQFLEEGDLLHEVILYFADGDIGLLL